MKTTSIHAKSGLSSLSFIFVFVFFLQFTSFSQTISVDGNPSDWPAVLQNQPIATFEKDLPQSDDNQFTEGTKDFHNTNNMVWSLSPVGDKVNLVNAGAAIIDGWLYFFGDRTSSNGSAQIGFWVFQNGTAPTPEFGFTPPKTVGDLLILSEFTNGGGVATIKVFRWVGPGGSESSLVEVPLTEAQALAMVSANSTGFPVPNYPDWEYCNKEAKDCGTYYPGSFFEGMVDLEGLLTPEQLCNATFLLETRQSFSLSAMLGDFVAGSFNISPDAPVVQGATLCAPGGDVSLSVVSPDDDLTYNWYSDADLNNLVHTGDNYDVNVAITTSWYVTASLLSCESDPTQVTATILPNPGLSATAFHVSCYGENDGKVTGTVTNAATVKLFANDVQLASTAPGMGGSFEFSGLSAGDYKVVAESAPVNSVVCSSEEEVTISEPAEVMLSISSLNVSCNGEADGSISFDSHSGTGSASFYISDDGGTTWTATTADDIEAGSYGPGTYMVKVTYPDGNDDGVCEATDEVTISEPALVTVTAFATDATCEGLTDGTVYGSSTGAEKIELWLGGLLQAETIPAMDGSYTFNGLAAGIFMVKAVAAGYQEEVVCLASADVTVNEIPCVVVCETAYAMLEEGSVCFLEDKFNRWGWTNQIVEGEYTLPLYAGAAQCNTENGEHVGNVSITYGGGTMVVTYTIFEGFSMSEVHIYVGAGKYPLKRGKATVAPGQYTYNVGSLDKVVEYTATFTGVSGPVWVIAHAVTCDVSGTATGSGSMALNLGSSMLKSASIEGLDASELKVFPNPFSARTTFEFVSGKDVNARLEIYSITGQRITTLMDRQVEQGVLNRVEFEPSNLTPGMLLYRLTLGNEVQNGKLQYTK